MVLFFTSKAVDPPVTIYMGKDKVENEELLKYGLPTDVWFHVDKLSSAHVYLRQPDSQPHGAWDSLPVPLLNDAAQLVKANSIEGNKKDKITVIYTPFPNLKKTGDMATGQVSFHNDKQVKRGALLTSSSARAVEANGGVHVQSRDNAIVNRLNKTKVEKEVDHEAERQERLRQEGRRKKAEAIERREAEQKKKWEEEKKQRSYDGMFTDEAFAERDQFDDDDFM